MYCSNYILNPCITWNLFEQQQKRVNEKMIDILEEYLIFSLALDRQLSL